MICDKKTLKNNLEITWLIIVTVPFVINVAVEASWLKHTQTRCKIIKRDYSNKYDDSLGS